jgi:antitoxin ParD1/3/4
MPSSVDLGKTLERLVNDLVRSGRYNSRSEVLREGVRLVQERRASAISTAIAPSVTARTPSINDANST